MTKELTTESGVRVVLAEVPPFYKSHFIYMGYLQIKVWNEKNGITDAQLADYSKLTKYLENHDPEKEYKTIATKLPDGELIGKRFNEMSEEECVPLVPYGTSSVEHMVEPKDLTGFVKSVDSYGRDLWTKVTSIFYKDFTKKPHHRSMSWTAHVATAKESLASLIRSHGYDPELTIVLTEKE